MNEMKIRKFIPYGLSLFISCGLLFHPVSAQDVLQNPKRPQNPDAGCILRLERTLTITDKGGEFYFTAPRDLKVDSEGCIYTASKGQILRFSQDGTFIQNLITEGQGPGEIKGHFRYALHDDNIYIYNFPTRKLVCLDRKGHFLDEIRFSEQFNDFYGLFDGNFLFLQSTWPPMDARTGKMMEIEERILQVTPRGEVIKKSPNFPFKAYLGPGFATWWTFTEEALDKDKNILYITHTSEYMIKALDLETDKVVKRFNRKYKRVKHKESKEEKERRKKRNLPRKKFENDISEIFFNQESRCLWVKTSTQSKEKGILYDVFDERGQYVDNFYLKLKGELLAVRGDSLFVSEIDEEGIISIAKYRILEQKK
jgi:hypothetical protein